MFSVTRWNLIRLVPGIMLCIKRWELGGLLGLSLMCQRVLPRLLNVFIEYADGMAKLPVKQASRMLYRYNLPNDTKKPRTLSKLSDNGAWERRKTKGKVAIQKMVVDLMELYLHRLKQRRPPYPKTSAMVDFSAQFPYEPTPDQKQSKAETEMNLEMIKHGHLDIIVGTHSLLGSRVVYNNLGLLVVDEEQFNFNSTSRKSSYKDSSVGIQ
ncbi:ATP-dependent DNA helicase At3g02060, chloroplastic isoform X4 [Populus alba]|uniref:ATP-dependent DNA helicase At3g02060, chloroplastic isoform X4 n=1 Tax=Populus alba TaxID=43335 RepID=UPI003CC7276B